MTPESNTSHPPIDHQAGNPIPTVEPGVQGPNHGGTDQPVSTAPAKPLSPLLLLAVGAVGGIVVGGVGTALALTSDFSGDPFPPAIAECGLKSESHADLSEDGRTLMLDHRGQDETRGLDLEALNCVLTELEVPANVQHEMEQTRALDGRQSTSWGGIDASWSYHPDSGLDVVLTRP